MPNIWSQLLFWCKHYLSPQTGIFTEILKRSTAVRALTFLVSKFHHLMSRSDLQCCLHQLRNLPPNWLSNMEYILALEQELESSLREILNLSQLSRISIRESLGGKVLSRIESLPIPTKMKHFLNTCEWNKLFSRTPRSNQFTTNKYC